MKRVPANMKTLDVDLDCMNSQEWCGESENTDAGMAVVCTPQNQPIEFSFTCPSVDTLRAKSNKKPASGSCARQMRHGGGNALGASGSTPSRQSWPARKQGQYAQLPTLRLAAAKLGVTAKRRRTDGECATAADVAEGMPRGEQGVPAILMSQDDDDSENADPNAAFDCTQTQGDGAANQLCTQLSMDLFLSDSQDASMDFVRRPGSMKNNFAMGTALGKHTKQDDALDGMARFHKMTQAHAIPNPFLDDRRDASEMNPKQVKTLVEQVCVPGMQRRKYAIEFAEVSVLGKGDFSTVTCAVQKTDGQKYAVKQTSKPFSSTILVMQALREVQALAAIPTHPNILRFYSAWLEQNCTRLYIQTECCELLKSRVVCPHEFGIDLIRALRHLHRAGIMHGDVKPENILVRGGQNRRPEYVLADFGLACRMHVDDLGANISDGDCRYLCPEILQRGGVQDFAKQHGVETLAKVDIFAFGMSLLEVCLWNRHDASVLDRVVSKSLRQRVLEGELQDKDSQLSCALREAANEKISLVCTVEMCLQADPHRRPTAETVLTWLESESREENAEINALRARIEALEKENKRLHRLLGT